MGSSQSAIQEHQATFHKVRRKEGGGGSGGGKRGKGGRESYRACLLNSVNISQTRLSPEVLSH